MIEIEISDEDKEIKKVQMNEEETPDKNEEM